ncbi:hypothetical protein ACHAWF_004780 [Thalassiosira exigua]
MKSPLGIMIPVAIIVAGLSFHRHHHHKEQWYQERRQLMQLNELADPETVQLKLPQQVMDAKAKMSVKNDDFHDHWPEIKQKLCPGQTPNLKLYRTLFRLAREELGVSKSSILLDDKRSQRFIWEFYTWSNGGVVFSSPDKNHSFAYLRIYKCANNEISGNLKTTLQQPGAQVHNVRAGWKKNDMFDHIPKINRNETCIVTAVRDPLEHFMSGYNELEFRNTEGRLEVPKGEDSLRHYSRFANGTSARFEQYVADLIGSALSPYGNQIKHVFSMTGILRLLNWKQLKLTAYLPTLKNLGEEFPKFLNNTCPGLPPDAYKQFPIKTHHHSQSDPYGFYAAAKRVVKENKSISKALCAIHAVDYACFDAIPVPEVCQGVFGSQQFRHQVLQ